MSLVSHHFDDSPGQDDPEEMQQQADDLMRQGRFQDAVRRYEDLRRRSPTDPWFSLAHASALECAGNIPEAERVIEELSSYHKLNAHVLRFKRMFLERREDFNGAARAREAVNERGISEGSPDQLAELYFNQGRYHEALAELHRVLAEGSREEPTFRASLEARIGACLRQDGNPEEAREHLLTALALDNENHWTLSELAECERAMGNVDAARRRYIEALNKNPDDHWCRGHLAQLEHETGHSDRAESLYRQILHVSPQAIWAKVELAQVLMHRDVQAATALCQEALEQDPSFPWAYTQLASMAKTRGDWEEARRLYQQALQASPRSNWILHELAEACRHLGRIEEAFAHLEHARAQNPYDAGTYGFTADVMRSQGRVNEAVANLVKAVELDPDYVWAWRELAELHALAGRMEEANQAYREAERIEPEDAINDGLQAFILRCAGRRDEAIPFLRRATQRNPQYIWAWRELGDCLLHLRRFPEAEEMLKAAQSALPDQAGIFASLAEAQRQQGKRPAALQSVETGLERDPTIGHLWAVKAELLAESDLPQAIACARRSIECGNAGPEVTLLLAQLLVLSGRDDEAKAAIAPMISHPQCSANAFDLAIELHLRAGQFKPASELCRQALERFPEDPRLMVRQATCELRLGRREGIRVLDGVWALPPAQVPWMDVTDIYVECGDRTLARRAAARYIDLAAHSAIGEAAAWRFWCERELRLGAGAEARECAERAVHLEPEHPAARLMAAMAAERQADHRGAIAHLDALERAHPQTFDPSKSEGARLRIQRALLAEAANDEERAAADWRILREVVPADADIAVHTARRQMRAGWLADAETVLDRAIEQEPDPERRAFLAREAAVIRMRRAGPKEAMLLLERFGGKDDVTTRLKAHCLIEAGVPEQAVEILEALMADKPTRETRILMVRALLAARGAATALPVIQALTAENPADEDAATIHADCLAHLGRLDAAIKVIHDQALPAHPRRERLLLGACLHLEQRDVPSALAWLGHYRLAPHDKEIPLIRLMAAAWPHAWAEAPGVAERDIRAFPTLFPTATRLVAKALAHAERPDLAAALADHVGRVLARQGRNRVARRLRAKAVLWWLRAGRRRRAFGSALAARSILLFARCLLPF